MQHFKGNVGKLLEKSTNGDSSKEKINKSRYIVIVQEINNNNNSLFQT